MNTPAPIPMRCPHGTLRGTPCAQCQECSHNLPRAVCARCQRLIAAIDTYLAANWAREEAKAVLHRVMGEV